MFYICFSPCRLQTVQVTPKLLGALTGLSWVCVLPNVASLAKIQAATHNTHLTTTIDCGVQMPLSMWQQSPDSKGDFELALLISQLPINLIVMKPDLPAKQDECEGLGSGEGKLAHDEVEAERTSILKLTAARKKTEWGPLISHCYSCYWRCILFTLKQLHSLDKDSSCGLTNGRTERASNANTEAITSENSKGNYLSLSHTPSGPSLWGRCSSEQSQRGQPLIPIASNDVNALIEVCLSTGLDLADDEVPTVIHCLCVLLPQVNVLHTYIHAYIHTLQYSMVGVCVCACREVGCIRCCVRAFLW